jgi:translation initiation factor IF-3
MPRSKALEMSTEQGLDLVQIAYDPKQQVSTAKIVDFGKRQYDKKKAENEKKKKQRNK